jgi:SRSO17 transposase
MITRALDAGTPAAWVTADEVYGQDSALRGELARRGLGYVLAIPQRHLITTGIGARPAIELAKRLPARAWQRMSAGPGATGPRWHDWALIEAADPAVTDGGGPHWLLIRRRIADGEYAFYRAHAPGPVPLAQLVKVAGSRWKSRTGSLAAKNSPPWTSTRSAAGPPGTGGPSWPCSPTHSWPCWPLPRLTTGTQTMTS